MPVSYSWGCCCCSVAKLCPTLCDHIHGVFQARMLEWIAISTPGDLPDPGRDQTHVTSCISCTGRWSLHHCTTWEAHIDATYNLRNGEQLYLTVHDCASLYEIHHCIICTSFFFFFETRPLFRVSVDLVLLLLICFI